MDINGNDTLIPYLSLRSQLSKTSVSRQFSLKIRAKFAFTALEIEQERAVGGKEVKNGTVLPARVDFCLTWLNFERAPDRCGN